MSFDLNIENYKRDELISMFDLPPNFDKNIVEIKESKLKDSIIKNKEINKETQLKTIEFLLKAKTIILNGPPDNVKDNFKSYTNAMYDFKTSELEDQEHTVQLRKKNPYIPSFTSDYYPGVINPLKKKIIKKNLNIDSRFRDNYYDSTATNFNVTLPIMFTNVISMQLAAIEMPATFNSISKEYGNNFFTIRSTYRNSLGNLESVSAVVTIPDGNYINSTILQVIYQALINLGEPYQYISFTINYTNVSTGTGQTLVGLSDVNAEITFELDFQADRYGNEDRNTPLPLKLGWILGFRNGIYTNNKNYVSEASLDTTGPRYVFLVVDDHNNNVVDNYYSAFNSSFLQKNILTRISLLASPFYILDQNSLTPLTPTRDYFGPVNLQNLTIQLLDEYGRILDINNMDFSFCITITSLYDL